MRRLIQAALIVGLVAAAGYAAFTIGTLILASVVSCGCAATPSPPLP